MRPGRGWLLAGLVLAGCGRPARDDALVAAGQRLYRDGVGRDGQPIQARVQGDVVVQGPEMTCAGCHGRSGMGTAEGGRRVSPITPPYLVSPRAPPRPRPGYTPASLAQAIREGRDAGGNALDPLMPRFALKDADLAVLLAYLETLPAAPSPGVEETTVHLATVVAPDVPAASRDTMLALLNAYVRQKNAGTANRRAAHNAREGGAEFYGSWALHVWDLQGPPDTWGEQLDAHYREQPVFALVSGLGAGTWEPVHRFCNARQVPCLLPNLDTPPDADGDFYAVYFSRGTVLEARALVAQLDAMPVPRVLALGHPEERALAALQQAARARGWETPPPLRISGPADPVLSQLAQQVEQAHATALALWVDAPELAALRPALEQVDLPVYLSSTVLGPPLPELREGRLLHPYGLPAEVESRSRRVDAWLRAQQLPTPPPALRRLVDQTFFALMTLGEGMMHVRKSLYRDYLLESLDHSPGLTTVSAFYPRLSWGPGQRYLSKGCSVVPLDGRGETTWVVP